MTDYADRIAANPGRALWGAYVYDSAFGKTCADDPCSPDCEKAGKHVTRVTALLCQNAYCNRNLIDRSELLEQDSNLGWFCCPFCHAEVFPFVIDDAQADLDELPEGES